MRAMRYVFLFAAFIGSFLALSAYIALPGSALKASVQPPEPKAASILSPERPEVLFRAFRHAFYDKQGNAWELEAKEASLLRNSAKTDLTGIRLHLTTPDGKVFVLEADKGRILFANLFYIILLLNLKIVFKSDVLCFREFSNFGF